MKRFKEETGAMGTDNAAAFDSSPSFPATKKKGVVGEDAPANAAGGGNIAGIGVGVKGEPGVHPKDQPKGNKTPPTSAILGYFRRKAPVMAEKFELPHYKTKIGRAHV